MNKKLFLILGSCLINPDIHSHNFTEKEIQSISNVKLPDAHYANRDEYSYHLSKAIMLRFLYDLVKEPHPHCTLEILKTQTILYAKQAIHYLKKINDQNKVLIQDPPQEFKTIRQYLSKADLDTKWMDAKSKKVRFIDPETGLQMESLTPQEAHNTNKNNENSQDKKSDKTKYIVAGAIIGAIVLVAVAGFIVYKAKSKKTVRI